MYYNVYQKKGKIYYSYKDEKTGKTSLESIYFNPTVGVLSDRGDYQDIYGNCAEKIEFKNIYEYRNYIKANQQGLCGVIDPVYQFICTHFTETQTVSTPDVWFIDIEVYSKDKFPEAKDADYMINAVTLYSILEDFYYTISLKDYTPKAKNIRYLQAVNEEHLLEMVIKLIEHRKIQIMSGWNVKYFDMLYIVNRMKKVYSDRNTIIRDWIEDNINPYTKEIFTMQILDYMKLYMYFSGLGKDDYMKLNDASKTELNEIKLEHEMPLWQLYDEDFETFIDYNIKDVELLSKIDKKRKLLETAMDLSNIMMALPVDVFSSEFLWNSYLYYYLNQQRKMLPFEHHPEKSIIGGYVAKPLPHGNGRFFNVVITDLVSSYPHQIIEFNISPETLVNPIDVTKEMSELRISLGYGGETADFLNNYIQALYNEDFCVKYLLILQKNSVIMAANGEFYRKDVKGLLPIVVEHMFKVRKIARDHADELNMYIHEIEELIKSKETTILL